jgi:hypothetical protein
MHILPQAPLEAQRSHSSHTGRRIDLPPQMQTRHGYRVVTQRPNTSTTLVGKRQELCLQYLTDFTRSRKTQAPNTCYRFAPSCPLQRVILHPPQSSQCWIRGGRTHTCNMDNKWRTTKHWGKHVNQAASRNTYNEQTQTQCNQIMHVEPKLETTHRMNWHCQPSTTQ